MARRVGKRKDAPLSYWQQQAAHRLRIERRKRTEETAYRFAACVALSDNAHR